MTANSLNALNSSAECMSFCHAVTVHCYLQSYIGGRSGQVNRIPRTKRIAWMGSDFMAAVRGLTS